MRFVVPVAVLLAGCGGKTAQVKTTAPVAYANPKSCAGCHATQAATHSTTGMGRAFARATPAALSREDFARRNTYYHAPSDRHYTMLRRGEEFFLTRHLTGPDGQPANVVEARIDYVLGSGNHARTYVHRAPDGRLIQLPLGWYPENGGTWAMNPGYDRPDHLDFRREIGEACMACHNGYPQPGGVLQGGIDCQRCHGPGAAHVEAAGKAPILQPVKQLSRERQMEVCMQCHLETTSFALPHAITRFGRSAFAYSPAEPLAAQAIHFDHAPDKGREDKFEIVSAVYRLRQSACFLKSDTLTCTTCHDPHRPGSRASAACKSCHAQAPPAAIHAKAGECVSCHMPKRRTEDVIHVVMTDHRVQRRPAADLTATRSERIEEGATAYRGEVALYYPANLSAADRDLYSAFAQVAQASNLESGIRRLAAAIEKHRPPGPEFLTELGLALLASQRAREAEPRLLQALERDPKYLPAIRGLADAARQQGQTAKAIERMQQALALSPRDAATLHELGRLERSAARVEMAVQIEPWFSEAWNTLGSLYAESGNMSRAEQAWREAVRHQPDLVEARVNLGNALAAAGKYGEAQWQAEAAAKANPRFPGALVLLGDLASRNRLWPRAADQYRKALALAPELDRAHLGLGMALLVLRDAAGARAHLMKAAQSGSPPVQAEASELLRELAADGPR